MAELHTIEPEDPDKSVVAALESALKAARNGEVASVAISIVYRSGVLGSKWSMGGQFARLLGAVQRTAHKLNLDMDAQ